MTRERLRQSASAHLYCWSTARPAYAHATAVEISIADGFVDFLAKPQLLVDDQLPSEWRSLACFHPNESSSMSVGEIEIVRESNARVSLRVRKLRQLPQPRKIEPTACTTSGRTLCERDVKEPSPKEDPMD